MNSTHRIADSYANFGTQESPLKTKMSYNLSFKIQFETSFGQHMCVVGSTPELGEWKKYIKLKWTDGHIWVSETPIPIENNIFKYKYLLLDSDQTLWESSSDRVADLRLFPEPSVEFYDVWEKFKLELAINYPGQNLFVEGLEANKKIKMVKKEGVYFCSVEMEATKNEKIEYIYYGLNEF